MSRGKISIRAIELGDLQRFTEQFLAEGKDQEISPLTSRRATAQALNPNGKPTDVGLIVAMDNQLCVGHVSVMPGVLRIGNQRRQIVWSNALYVLPSYRNTTAAFQLIKKLTSLDRDVFVTGFNPPSRDLCRAFGFTDFATLQYLSVDFRGVDFPGAIFRRIKRLGNRRSVPVGYQTSRWYLHLKKRFLRQHATRCQKIASSLAWREVDMLQPLHPQEHFTAQNDLIAEFERDIATVNWMLAHPWVGEHGPEQSPPYYFSDLRPLARYHAVEFTNAEMRAVGFGVFFVTEKRGMRLLRVLDSRHHDEIASETFNDAMVAAAMYFANRYQVDQWMLPLHFRDSLRRMLPVDRIMRVKTRDYQWLPVRRDYGDAASSFDPSSIRLSLTDGDCAFG